MKDDLRPKGTVEVQCSHPGCGMAWWVDPLDSRLTDGEHEWDCGDNHKTREIVFRHLSTLRLEYGVSWGSIQGTGPAVTVLSGCGGMDLTSGHTLMHDREHSKTGLLSWKHPKDLSKPERAFAAIEWDRSKWPVNGVGLPEVDTKIPPGYVQTVGYEVCIGRQVRQYTFVPCVRPGCFQRVMVDYDDPVFKPVGGHAVGSWGGSLLPEPAWWGTKTFRCEDGISTFPPQPCALIHGDTIQQFEQSLKARWTMWWAIRDVGTVFFSAENGPYGLLTYKGQDAFLTLARVTQNIRWGTLMELESILRDQREDQRGGGAYRDDEVLAELQKHVRLPS